MKQIKIASTIMLLMLAIIGCSAVTSSSTTTTGASTSTSVTTTGTATTTSTTSTTASSVTTTTGGGSHAMVGTWVGTWEDTRYSVQGSLSATFTQVGPVLSGTGTIGLSSLSIPGVSTESGSATGVISGSDVVFTFSSGTVGSGNGALVSNVFIGTGEVTGSIGYGAFTFIGTLDAIGNRIDGTFIFLAPTGGYGIATVAKQ